MYLRKSQNQRSEISIDEPLKVDWDGNENDAFGYSGHRAGHHQPPH